jgi:hypothetical protein
VDAVVIHNRAFNPQFEPSGGFDKSAISLEANSLAGYRGLILQIHFQFFRARVIFQNESSLRRIYPPDIAFEMKGTVCGRSLGGQKPDLMDIGYLGGGVKIELRIRGYGLRRCFQSNNYKATKNDHYSPQG